MLTRIPFNTSSIDITRNGFGIKPSICLTLIPTSTSSGLRTSVKAWSRQIAGDRPATRLKDLMARHLTSSMSRDSCSMPQTGRPMDGGLY
jgi:hypothetical protein